MSKKPRGCLAFLTVTLVLIMAMLACTSNDTLFIKLTATPSPTITPTPLNIQTKYQKGQQLYAVDAQKVITFDEQPGSQGVSGFSMTSCFRNTQVTILDASMSISDPKDPWVYYQVDCGSGGQGWVPEYKLTPFNPSGGMAVVKSPDGKGAPIYSEGDVKSPLATQAPCPDGTKVEITDILRSTNLSATEEDTNKYARVDCNGTNGYIVESMLAPAS